MDKTNVNSLKPLIIKPDDLELDLKKANSTPEESDPPKDDLIGEVTVENVDPEDYDLEEASRKQR